MTLALPMRRLGRALVAAALAAAACAALAQTAISATPDLMRKKAVPVRTAPGQAKSVKADFSGQMTIASRLAKDPDQGRDSLVLLVDMNGTAATRNGVTYTVTSMEEFVKPNGPSHTLQFTFPVSSSSGTVFTGVANVALNVDTATGDVTSATVTLSGQ